MTNRPLSDTATATHQARAKERGTEGRLEQTARQLAANHTIDPQANGQLHLLERLPVQEKLLHQVHQYYLKSTDEELALSYAAEWLLDNFYLVQQSLRQVEEDLPKTYYRQLPKLNTDSPLSGYPRIYALARQLITYDDCQVDLERVQRFVHAYQQVHPLTMGELWALPSMLRLALLESLAQAAGRITDLFSDTGGLAPALRFPHGIDDTDVVAHSVSSLRLLDNQDWKTFFESVSQVEQSLRNDPVDIYTRMNFDTRDHYRKVVEELALATGLTEVTVAKEAVKLAQSALSADSGRDGRAASMAVEPVWVSLDLPRTGHVGYYLLSKGRAQLEQHIDCQPGWGKRLRRWLFDYPTLVYLGSIGLLTLLLIFTLLWYVLTNNGNLLQLLATGLLVLIPAVTISVSIINQIVTHTVPPGILPKLDFEDGIPARCRTMVVIPAMLTDSAEVKSLLNQLELHYLRNPDPNLTFALLTDFADAPESEMPDDERLVTQADTGVRSLNQRYTTRPFFLFHRRRMWNPGEGVWMGWERKRGKLHEFNQLLRGHNETSYEVQTGNLDILPHIRYVITLDADTILPRESAHRLVGTLAHPLNQPKFDPETGEVVAGYTILQPRTEIKPVSANQSLFARVFAGDTGLDLYTLAVSDVYQDLFGEGIYVGKGIYDVDAFERSLAGRVPDNTLLSHDLFEGIQGRVALVTDIVFYEDYPRHYLVQVRRIHRWVRGDWQLLPWLLPRVPSQNGRVDSTLSVIDLWKIIDNLRRSLLSLALLLLFLAGWIWLPGSAAVWTVLGLLTPAMALATNLLTGLMRGLAEGSLSQAIRPLRNNLIRWLLFLAFLPYETVHNIDAILTTLARLFITRKHLLQWTTAAHTARLFSRNIQAEVTWRQMVSSLVVAVVLALLVFLNNPAALPAAAPFLLIWMIGPEFAYAISRPSLYQPEAPSLAQRQQLRHLTRHTWLYFEQFVGPDDNWLPSDHFQESPRGVVAHRTSPTNVGLYLLSMLAACDMGYVGPMDLILRLRSTFDTLDGLERYRGHFLNWIDTRSLTALPPPYVSTVDSGNLAACLLVLKQGCLTLPQEPICSWNRWQGLLDTLALLAVPFDSVAESEVEVALREHLDEMRRQIVTVRDKPEQWATLLWHLSETGQQELSQRLMAVVESEDVAVDAKTVHDWRIYAERVRYHLNSMQREVELLIPWLLSLSQPPPLFTGTNTPPAVGEAWRALKESLSPTPRLSEIVALCNTGQDQLGRLQELLAEEMAESPPVEEAVKWCQQLAAKLSAARMTAESLTIGCEKLAQQAEAYFEAMDFRFLFDRQRQVFHIGYNVETDMLDPNYYDLLASEARIAGLIAIAKHDVPQNHWLYLARPLTQVNGGRTLLSWSGTMFEYLMPSLLMRSYTGTLLNQSCRNAIEYQMAYGRQNNVPWGISESGYYAFDANMNYQYRAFGVPRLGLKRGLADDLVITPYASLLALSFHPQAVLQNISHLIEQGLLGCYGLYEAVDYTSTRLPLGRKKAIVRSYMVHHQGMILISLLNTLQDNKMVNRFHAEPRIQSVELLLQEHVPLQTPLEYPQEEAASAARPKQATTTISPWDVPVDTPMPQVQFLSNGHYGTLMTSAGGGHSQWQETALTRWRADTTQDDWGHWLYVQDRDSNALWSAGTQPTLAQPENQKVYFHPHKTEFRRQDHGIALTMEVTVAPGADVEIRRVTLTNKSDQSRRLRLTSYGEVVLAPAAADQRHPAFAKLFVESQYLPATNALLFRRRPRSADEERVFLIHALVTDQGQAVTGAHESDRARFLGRGGTSRRPQALTNDGWLSGTTGATLDPIMSLGQEIELAPRARAKVAFITLAAESRSKAIALVEQHQVWTTINRTFTRARTQSERELRRLEFGTTELKQTQQLLSLLFYPHASLRPDPSTLAGNGLGQSGLWGFGISGDYPILLLHMYDDSEGELLHDLLQAHTFWRRRNLNIDFVILNEKETTYGQELQGYIHRLIHHLNCDNRLNQRGGIFVLRRDQMDDATYTLLQTAARVVLDGQRGNLAEQLAGIYWQPTPLPDLVPTLSAAEVAEPTPPLSRPDDLQFDNGWGGFSADGREYVVYLRPGESTPAPWINVIANPNFGFLVSESGGGYTWAVNSGENRLSAWRNDPVTDMPAEVLYLRDEETAESWSPTPQPAPAEAPYLIRHGAGYSVFEHHSHGLKQELRLFTDVEAPVKVVQLRLENQWQRPRRLTATYYAAWVLGTNRSETQQYLIPEYHEGDHALLARNPYNAEFGARVAFVASNKEPHGLTADRTEFLGRWGTLRRPAALTRVGLNSRMEAGLDCCAALQLHIELAPGTSEEIYFLVGQGADREETLALIQRFQDPDQIARTWKEVKEMWDDILDTANVETPDAAMDLLLNRWLLYQALACRFWGRSALYQSSGAYGFRDQLQDVMSLVHARPDLTRQHILRSARHQFEAGDVLHWWHPPSGRGVRTRITDDLLWLPFVTAHYVATTADLTILDEEVPFLKGEPLAPDEEERYGHYESSDEPYSLYEHCRRVLEKGTTSGPHGLPLIGSGDWNDGMNRVGIEGKGESIWLGWFIHYTLTEFAQLCQRIGEEKQAETYRQWAEGIRQALEKEGWDGQWYRRAYYDDGTPLGSSQNMECQIDSIAQSWGVLSGAADPERAKQAMEAVRQRLVRRDDRLILLFTPPFDRTPKDPGYIKGYLPGIRENGGQYTHAALWSIWALAQLGEGDLAAALFRLINPVYRADTPEKADRYKVEPYVISADVYGVEPHVGRGGWTWYTGSSGWMYRLGLEAILGLRRKGEALCLDPHIPREWPGYRLTYQYGQTTYVIQVKNPDGVNQGVKEIVLDGKRLPDNKIPLQDDGRQHLAQVRLGQ